VLEFASADALTPPSFVEALAPTPPLVFTAPVLAFVVAPPFALTLVPPALAETPPLLLTVAPAATAGTVMLSATSRAIIDTVFIVSLLRHLGLLRSDKFAISGRLREENSIFFCSY